jgi:flagellar basal body-associated protein FliL
MDNQVPNHIEQDAQAASQQAADIPAAPAPRRRSSPYIPAIVTIVILLIAALVGFYLYGLSLTMHQAALDQASQGAEASTSQDESGLQETSSIEQDLNATDVDNSDAGLNNIDPNFQQ